MDLLLPLAQTLREHRKKLSMTQAESAARSGIPLRTYLRMEAGDESVKIGTYARAALGLGLALTLSSRARPTLDELEEVYRDE